MFLLLIDCTSNRVFSLHKLRVMIPVESVWSYNRPERHLRLNELVIRAFFLLNLLLQLHRKVEVNSRFINLSVTIAAPTDRPAKCINDPSIHPFHTCNLKSAELRHTRKTCCLPSWQGDWLIGCALREQKWKIRDWIIAWPVTTPDYRSG